MSGARHSLKCKEEEAITVDRVIRRSGRADDDLKLEVGRDMTLRSKQWRRRRHRLGSGRNSNEGSWKVQASDIHSLEARAESEPNDCG